MAEKLSEARHDRTAIGTTSRGIGPTYEDKIARRGIRMAELVDGDFESAYRAIAEDKMTIARAFHIEDKIDFDSIHEQYLQFAARLRPMVTDTAKLLNDAMAEGRWVLFEGAQGTMLDVDHGTYPFVTSSSATAGGACTGTGVAPTRIDGIVGISKAYITRVGAGPFPTEDSGAQGDLIRNRGKEFGSVTGRPRRCGWFDAPLLQYTAAVNGFDSIVITKLDVLDTLEEIPVCVAYEVNGKRIGHMPATAREFGLVKPVYENFPGWKASTSGVNKLEDLPRGALEYINYLAKQSGVEIGAISTGPERSQTVEMPGSKLSQLLAR
jgi:adenylosuccinate synthase